MAIHPADAAALRDAMLEKGLSIASVKRNFSTIRSIINLTISEQGLDCGNAFARTFMPEQDRQRRLPIPIDCMRAIQSDCRHMDDDMRWLVALLSDTGMRLGEAVGLAVKDINLDDEIPHHKTSSHIRGEGLKPKEAKDVFHWLEKPSGRLLGRLRLHLEVIFSSPDIIVLHLAMPTLLQQP